MSLGSVSGGSDTPTTTTSVAGYQYPLITDNTTPLDDAIVSARPNTVQY
jgi:hypothetical protein